MVGMVLKGPDFRFYRNNDGDSNDLNMENVHKITFNQRGIYHVTLIKNKMDKRNKNIDNCMKMFQLRTRRYEDVIEWIPFDRLSDIEEIASF